MESAIFRREAREGAPWRCAACSAPLRALEWLGKPSAWARAECQARGWGFEDLGERAMAVPEPVRLVACVRCANWSRRGCIEGFTVSDPVPVARICGKYQPKQ